jgi:hydrogenase/urease accessory protein HupE
MPTTDDRAPAAAAFFSVGSRCAAGATAAWLAIRRLAIFLVALGGAIGARGHDPGISLAQIRVLADRIEISTGFAPPDAQALLPPAARPNGRWTAEEFQQAEPALLAIAPQLWEVSAGGAALAPRESRVQLEASDNASFTLVFPRPEGATRLTLRAPKLPELPPGHRQFVIVADAQGSTLTKKLLNAKDPVLEAPLIAERSATAEEEPPPSAWGFVKLGVEHIWTGYDHLLFLFALLVVCRSFRSIAAIVTCFTLAHSLTLACATLGWVDLPARFVEPAIAASIVFVGVENLWRRGEEPRGRGALTFAFGLIHGFGFASVLRELGVGQGGEGIAVPLVTFNLGVEIGQIAIAAVVLPVVWQLRRREWFVRRAVPALSVAVVLAGAYWFFERTLLA